MSSAQNAWNRLSNELWKAVHTNVGDGSSGDAAPEPSDPPISSSSAAATVVIEHKRRRSSARPDELVYTSSRSNFRAASASLDAPFPTVNDTSLFSLFPPVGAGHALSGPRDAAHEQGQASEARRCVRAALNEMKLHYDLDPGLLGERSDISRGYAQIAWLMSNLQLANLPLTVDEGLGDEEQRLDPLPEAEASTSTKAHTSTATKMKRPYETYDLLKAIDQHDIETIISIRDNAFDLLLDITTGAATTGTSDSRRSTPLGYAMGLGPKYEDVAIVLVGTLSRFVNMLPDILPESNKVSLNDPFKQTLDPRTMARLRKIRTNLKLAIDTSLASKQTSLLASYCQVLIMSEGTMFIHNAVAEVQLAVQHRLRGTQSSSTHDDPFAVALSALLKFLTQNLRTEQKSRMVGQAQEYLDNASGDLVLMALWDMVKLSASEARNITVTTLKSRGSTAPEDETTDIMDDESRAVVPPALATPLPSYYFARDERVTTHFEAQVRMLDEQGYNRPRSTVLAMNKARRVADTLATAPRMNSTQRLALLKTLF